MLIRTDRRGYDHPLSSEITPQPVYQQRRDWLRLLASGVAGGAMAAWVGRDALAEAAAGPGKLTALPGSASKVVGATTMEKITDYQDASSYNNFYEFGTDKSDPARYAHTLKTDPWSIEVEGLVKKPGRWTMEDLLKLAPMEQRLLENAVDKLGLSARAYHRILRVARTIADLAGVVRVEAIHLGEAIQYRHVQA